MNRIFSLLFSILFLLLTTETIAQQAAPQYQQTVVIQLAGKYSGSPIENVVYVEEYWGFMVNTLDGRGHFLSRNEAKEYLGIIFTDEGFLLPKDASVIYYDQNGVPGDTYQKNDYARVNSKMFPLPVKGFQMRYGGSNTPQPLWLIDKKEVSKQAAMALLPETIKSVAILNRDSAMKRYGEKAGAGAVSITMEKIRLKDTVRHIELSPSFPGGLEAWRHFIDTSIRYPPAALQAGIKGKVTVSMVIEKDGSLTATPMSRLGYGLEEEAIRVVTSSPKWSPATQDGRPVTYRFSQSLTFDTM